MSDPDWVTIKEACAVVGGAAKPIHPATYYRGVKLGLYTKPEKVAPNISRVDRTLLRARIQSRRGSQLPV